MSDAVQASERSFLDDIRAQPGNLLAAAATFLEALGEVDLEPFRTEPLAFTGMGASWFVADAAAREARASGRRAVAVNPTDAVASGGAGLGAAWVGVSQTGRSAETVAALEAVRGPRLALTRTGNGPLADAADVALPIGGTDDTGISVLTYTASLFAVAGLAAALAGDGLPTEAAGDLAARMRPLLATAGPLVAGFADRIAGARAIDVVGGGVSATSAGYGALLIREAARIPAAGFETHQYLHGPLEAVEGGLAVVLLGSEREIELASELASHGAAVLMVTEADVAGSVGVVAIRIPSVRAALRPILEAVPAQLLAAHLARARGLSPGTFRLRQDDTKLESS